MGRGLTAQELVETRDKKIAQLKQLQAERHSAGQTEAPALDDVVRTVTAEIRMLDTLLKTTLATDRKSDSR